MSRFFTRLLRRLLAPLIRFYVRRVSVDDPWEVTRFVPPPERFAAGSRHPFSWYFEGESSVQVDNLDAVFEWLSCCEYVSDQELFHERDFWQHPRTFERLRKGDCEDHALWAWRKLNELGIDAEFFCGCRKHVEDGSHGGHAWVIFETDGSRFLMEPAMKEVEHMVRPLAEVRDHYLPSWSVDCHYRTKSYMGWYEIQQAKLRERKELSNKR